MPGVGNDIVDLATPGAMGKSLDERFLQRVFTPNEQALIARSHNPDTLLWALWAAKETALKSLRKTLPDAPAIPKQYEVEILGDDLTDGARVHTPKGTVHVWWDNQPGYVHCLGARGDVSFMRQIDYGVGQVPAGPKSQEASLQSRHVRFMAVSSLSRQLSIAPERLEIVRHPTVRGLGPPMVMAAGKTTSVDLSLSHHGRFAAHAFFCDPFN